MLADACEAAGYPSFNVPGDLSASTTDWVVWDVPVLEPYWPGLLVEAAQEHRVIALLGFADRESVAIAKRNGALACLDLPCEPIDLIAVLDRLTSTPRPSPGQSSPQPRGRPTMTETPTPH